MSFQLDLKNKTYFRKSNIIYEADKPIIKLLEDNFVDSPTMTELIIGYMNRYMAMYPKKVEIMSEESGRIELNLREDADQHQAYLDRNGPKIIKMFFDLETTGVDNRRHGIHQIAGCFEINGVVVEEFNIRVQPNPKAKIEPDAMKICGVTAEQIMAYPEMGGVYREFVQMLGKYVERYSKTDKIWLVGYNNRSFDDNFLRAWFEQNNDTFFGAWFWTDSLDALVLASQYLINRRKEMVNFKLMTVARELGITVDESRLHDALYDIELTRSVYRIVTGIDFEL